MSIGLLVDFNMHILLRYYEAPCCTRDDKVKDALQTMGSSVMIGGFSTLLGVLPLIFSSSELMATLFYGFVGMVVLGCSHGLILLPVLLSMFGPLDTVGTRRKTVQDANGALFDSMSLSSTSSSSDESTRSLPPLVSNGNESNRALPDSVHPNPNQNVFLSISCGSENYLSEKQMEADLITLHSRQNHPGENSTLMLPVAMECGFSYSTEEPSGEARAINDEHEKSSSIEKEVTLVDVPEQIADTTGTTRLEEIMLSSSDQDMAIDATVKEHPHYSEQTSPVLDENRNMDVADSSLPVLESDGSIDAPDLYDEQRLGNASKATAEEGNMALHDDRNSACTESDPKTTIFTVESSAPAVVVETDERSDEVDPSSSYSENNITLGDETTQSQDNQDKQQIEETNGQITLLQNTEGRTGDKQECKNCGDLVADIPIPVHGQSTLDVTPTCDQEALNQPKPEDRTILGGEDGNTGCHISHPSPTEDQAAEQESESISMEDAATELYETTLEA